MIRRFLGSLDLIEAVMLAASAGGVLWLVMVHIAAMSHGPARMLAVLTGIAVFLGLRRIDPTQTRTPVAVIWTAHKLPKDQERRPS